MAVPEGSCAGTGGLALAGSEQDDGKGRPTGVCPICFGRFRLSGGTTLPNHHAARNVRDESER
jgi:hypothetical protein